MYCDYCKKLYECFEDHKECIKQYPTALHWLHESQKFTEKMSEKNK
jgi:hypothetical protein